MRSRLAQFHRVPQAVLVSPSFKTVSAAVWFALYCMPNSGYAQEQNTGGTNSLQEIIVTAQRRDQTLESIPYSLTAVSADQLEKTGTTDIASLTRQVPGLSMYDLGARNAGATTPIIRGINVSAATFASPFRTFEQSPVGIYIGNAPIDGYFQLDDVQRVEILRGPQGTLYGAGALGGALRIIPTPPELDKFSGHVEIGGGTVSHSSGASYTASGMLNVPVGDTLALRVSGKYAYEPGFIDVYGILERTGSPLSGIPILANPGDPVNSSGIFTGKKDWNHQDAFTGRASMLWRPAEKFNAELAFTYAKVKGDGGPTANPDFPGGSYPIDPRIIFPAGGNYREFSSIDQPFSRTTELTSFDLSYDAGFATLSSTSSYYTTNGSAMFDAAYGLFGFNELFAGFTQYYAGNPINPRYVNPDLFADSAHTFTQEVRLVSGTGPDKVFDYILGVFYEKQTNQGSWTESSPGSPEYAVAEGCTAPYFFGASFPNCLLSSGPGDVFYQLIDTQRFEDKSVFGELTWHFAPHGQLTLGARHFKETFTDVQPAVDYAFGGTLLPAAPYSAPASKTTGKVNPSYEYATNHHVYAIWSQGFRRGGSNSFRTHPPLPPNRGEDISLLRYRPDTVNNYEIGLKGHFSNRFSYAFDVFDDQWSAPQVSGNLPSGNLAVFNIPKAVSKGFEFELTSPLLLPGLSATIGGAYVDATLSKSYDIAADRFGDITGTAGQQLPGGPKVSAAATINYERKVVPDYDLTISLNDTYRSVMLLSTFALSGQGQASVPQVPAMNIVNLSASVSHGSWKMGVYATNLTDKRAILAPPFGPNHAGNLTNSSIINQPREIDLRLAYSF